MPIKGVWRVPKTLADGQMRFYYYTHRGPGRTLFWKSETPLDSKRLPVEFVEAYNQAISLNDLTAGPGTFGHMVNAYQKSCDKFKRMKPRSANARLRYLQKWQDMPMRNGDVLANAPLEVFDRRAIVARLIAYRNEVWSHSPSAAEEAQVALSSFLAWCKQTGRLDFNRLSGVASPYRRQERQRLWTPEEQTAFLEAAPIHLALFFKLGLFTGLRLGDLVRLPESAIRGDHLIIPTAKSRGQNSAIIPIVPEWRTVIDDALAFKAEFETSAIPLLVNSRGRPWTASGLCASFDRLRKQIGLGPDKNGPSIHDLRKTASTQVLIMQKRYPDAITDQVIIDWFGWTTGTLEKMKRIYVSDDAVISAITGGT